MLQSTFAATVHALTAAGVDTEYRVLKDSDAYAPVTGGRSDVFSLQVDLGPGIRRKGETTCCLFQVFDPSAPNLSVFFLSQRDTSTGEPVDNVRLPWLGYRQDGVMSYRVLPLLNRMLARLDPSGNGRSLQIGVFHGRNTFIGKLAAPVRAWSLLRNFRRDGQSAIIWTDFDAPVEAFLCRMAGFALASRDIRLLPRTRVRSELRIPLQGKDGRRYHFTDLSTALDAGLRIGRQYLGFGGAR